MNIPESVGETSSNSCRRQENGDSAVECERPLKKARFAWQVKGRYHLKNETPENKPISNTHEANSSSSSSENESDTTELTVNTEQNLEILGDYLLKQDFDALDSVAETVESPSPSTSLPIEKSLCPKYVTSCSSRNENCINGDSYNTSRSSVNNSIRYVEDERLIRWQSRQIAKCYIDNTINRVLDNWMIAPLPVSVYDLEDRTLCLDVAEFLNNYQGDNNTVENEGILMAISAHGLQNTSNSSNDSLNFTSDTISKDFLLSPSSPPSDEDFQETNLRSKDDQPESSNDMKMSWLCSDKIEQDVTNETPMTYYPEASSSSSQSYSEIVQNSNECGQVDDYDDILNDHYDFMDAAVSYAIQCKGLTSLGTDG